MNPRHGNGSGNKNNNNSTIMHHRRQSGFRQRATTTTTTTTTATAAMELPPGPLVVGVDARWLRLPSGARLELPRQRALRLILLAMVGEHLARPGSALSNDQLLARGWPGERVIPTSGGIRVRVAVSKLRSLGLREIICSRDDGYLLRADAVVILEDRYMHYPPTCRETAS